MKCEKNLAIKSTCINKIYFSNDKFNLSFIHVSLSLTLFRFYVSLLSWLWKRNVHELYLNESELHHQHHKNLCLILHFWPLSLILSLFDQYDWVFTVEKHSAIFICNRRWWNKKNETIFTIFKVNITTRYSYQ